MHSKTNIQDNHQEWPANGIESVHDCPVCGADVREILHKGLSDRIFNCAPGEWTMYRCMSCGSGYLNPRPTLETIHLAYETYYTHSTPDVSKSQTNGIIRRLRWALVNGYLNWRFGANHKWANRFGIVIALFYPRFRITLDRRYRNLPKAHMGAYLLDVGFGNGAFLKLAENAGWRVAGVDSDLVTINAARKKGFNVRHGGIESFDDMENCFDVITLSHVIEHVHDPREVLRKAYRLLKPGGHVWLETPNIDSFGHRRYKRHWRGLEPPRHLIIFNWNSLETLLAEEGFCLASRYPRTDSFVDLAAKSRAIKEGTDPYNSKITIVDKIIGLVARFLANIDRRHTEFITVQFTKPITKE